MAKQSRLWMAALLLTHLALPSHLLAGGAIPPPAAKDKCPVCGMFVSGYPNWLAAIRLKNDSVLYFDGPKDMLTYYLHPGKYTLPAGQAAITEVTVKDFYTLKTIDARQAYFVVGSNVFGPMGKELVPLAERSAAQEFLKDHQGKKIYTFNEITPALLQSLE